MPTVENKLDQGKTISAVGVGNELSGLDSYLQGKHLLFMMHMSISISVLRKEKKHETFLSLARNASNKSKCFKRHVGALLVKNGEILSEAHNGVPYDTFDCAAEKLCNNSSGAVCNSNSSSNGCKALCAEQLVIAYAARNGTETAGATLYCNFSPCLRCAMAIVAAKIKEVVYEQDYPDDMAKQFLEREGTIIWKHS